MTATMRHITDLSVDEWAAVTRRAAQEAVAAAARRGKTPPAELVTVAAMTERQLAQRRERNVPANQRLSPLMQLVDADHRRRLAEGRARDAHQNKLDAEATAAAARVEADESSRMAAAARAQLRTVQQKAAEQEIERNTERAAVADAHERALHQLQGELEKVRSDAAADVAAARERAAAAERRAEERTAERTSASEAAEKAAQQLRAELEKVRSDSAAEVAAAWERAAAAEGRAKERTTERTSASEAAERTAQQLRRELERVRADAEAEVAASRGWATGEATAAREAADAEIARAYAAADEAVRQAQAQAAHALAIQPLAIPVPSFEFRSQTGHIENALNALQRIDYVLEVDMADDGDPSVPLDVDLMETLAWVVRDHARFLADETHSAPSSDDAVGAYVKAAATAFGNFLQRIEAAARRLADRHRNPDVDVVNIVNAMLADPWVKRARDPGLQAP